MSNFPVEILDLYTSYATLKITLLAILVTIPVAVFFFLKSRSKKLMILMLGSQLISMVIYLIVAFIGNKYFTTVVDTFNQIGLFMVLVLNNLNLTKYGSDHLADILRKDSDPDRVNRAHFKSTLNMGITVLLLGLSTGFFVPSEYGQTILSIMITTISILAINHLLVRKLFVDEDGRD